MKTGRSVTFYCLFVMICVSIYAQHVSSEEAGSITGQWKLNEKESDDPREKFREAFKKKRSSGDSGGRPSGRPGGFGVSGKERPSGGGMKEVFETPESMTITFLEPEIKIADPKGKEQIFYTDGRKTEKEGMNGRLIAFTSKWEDNSLIVESQAPDGGKIVQTFYLSLSGKQLYVKSRIKPLMLDESIMIVRVYDSVSSEDNPK